MVYINKNGYNQEAKRRKGSAERAERYSDLEPRFIEWANKNNIPPSQIAKDVRRLRSVIEHHQTISNHESD